MRSIRTALLGFTITAIVFGQVRADDIPTPTGVCIRGARNYTCPDGSTIDACDDCSGGGGSSGGGNGNAGRGIAILIGGLIAVAAFPVMFAVAPGFTLELWFAKGSGFGNKAAAKERWKRFAEDRRSTENLGKRIAKTNAWFDKDAEMRDAMSSSIPAKRTLATPAARFWWTDKPHLQPSHDFACKQAALEYPSHMLQSDPIGSFANSAAMLAQCSDTYQKGDPAVPAVGGQCDADHARCMHLLPAGSAACCRRGYPIFNAVDEHCYRDTDYRGADTDEARRFPGGEYCPASSSP